MAETKELDHAQQNAKCGLESIREMVAALECDYERLEELRDERDALAEACQTEDDIEEARHAALDAGEALKEWDEENGEELRDLIAAAGECSSREQAEERIQEDPLSLEVRSYWYTLDADEDARKPGEFNILLTTGGPALRIIGELSDGEPTRARLEYQDWGTPWTEYITTGEDHAALLTYCRCFYFGE